MIQALVERDCGKCLPHLCGSWNASPTYAPAAASPSDWPRHV